MTNILFHSFNAFLISVIALLIGKKLNLTDFQKYMFSLSSGFIFLTAPSHTESVSWISGRTDVVATCFCLFSFAMYVAYKNYNKTYLLIISSVLFFAALCSKECVIFYPALIFLYELYLNYPCKHIRKVLPVPCLYGFLFALYMLIRYIQLGTFIGGYGTGVHLNFIPFKIIQNIILYPVISILPPLYDSIHAITFSCLFFMIIIIYSCIFFLKHKELKGTAIFLIISAAISILPAANLLPLPGIYHTDTQGQRFLYLPSSFTALYTGFLLSCIRCNKKIVTTLCMSFLIILAAFLYSTNKNWEEASRIAENIISNMEQFDKSERLFMANLPDNFNGAYIYRNGFHHAIKLFRSELKSYKINIILFNAMYDINEEILIESLEKPYTCRVILTGKKSYFMNCNVPIEETFSNKYYDVPEFKDKSYILKFKKFTSDDRLVIYSAGRLINVSSIHR
ncbi:MAG: hypothetical protein ABRQ39_17250 [Candidatus Eremiobacterota bacterium]